MTRVEQDWPPARMVRLSLKIGQHGDLPPVGWAVDFAHGTRSENYLRIPYYEIKTVIDEDGNPGILDDIPGDPGAPRGADVIYSRRRQAAVIAAGRSALDQYIDKYNGKAAVAVTLGKI